MDITSLVETIRSYPGITRKRSIHRITDALHDVADFGNTAWYAGEDAAAIRHNDGFLLLAADGIWAGLISDNPYGAGKAAVMASVNDIYAMGGRPLAMVNVIGIPAEGMYEEIVRGIRRGCEKFRVPMVGGHLHPDVCEPELSVAILGAADNLLLSNNARAGQEIVLAVDLDGRGYQCRPVLSWDTNSGKTTDQVLARLNVLPQLADSGLCRTAKDVSNGGILGTIGLMLEASGTGARVSIDAIVCPPQFPLRDWLRAFLSYGFVLSVDPECTRQVLERFHQQSISATVIGRIIDEPVFEVSIGGETAVLYDFSREELTGACRCRR